MGMERGRNSRQRELAWLAVDGEAEGSKYSLMCDSTMRSKYRKGGLSTKECFDFLLSADQDELCCFGLTYDANNWLVSLHRDTLRVLWERGSAVWVYGGAQYRIKWIPAKEIRIEHLNSGRKVTVVEVWSFFQTSFVKACEAWGIAIPDEIKLMKERRGKFTKEELKRVTAYCLQECLFLSEIMDKLEATCNSVGIVPRKWIGPGQLAAAMLEREGVGFHHRSDDDLAAGSEPTLDAIRSAYFGGRVEAYAQGDFEQTYSYDLNSAYPAGAMRLPSLAGAKLRRVAQYEPASPYALWHCHWDSERDFVTPFPARKKYDIWYPKRGSGWYHAIEVQEAVKQGHAIQIDEGYVLEDYSDEQPFQWIPAMYEHRRQLKAEGDFGQMVLKLALNSLYGKMAQGISYRGLPRWQSFYWAGMITAWTRAEIMKLISKQTPLMVATDGVFFEKPLDIETGDRIGDWSAGYAEGFFLLKPGVYLAWNGLGHAQSDYVRKSRGFFSKEVNYGALRQLFKETPPPHSVVNGYAYDSRRFIGMGTALHRKDFSQWLTWRKDVRVIHFLLERRMAQTQQTLLEGRYLRAIPGPVDSEPYRPKHSSQKDRPKAEPVSEDWMLGLEQPNIGADI